MKFMARLFISHALHNKRITAIAVLSLIPAVFTLLFILLKPVLFDTDIAYADLYPKITRLLYLHFLLPLLALFLGAAIIGDEREEQTLAYLLTRPVPRYQIVMIKLLAGWVMLSIILMISLLMTYTMLALAQGGTAWFSSMGLFIRSGMVIVLGAAVYLPFFAVAGGFFKRPVVAGLFFVFGWEGSVIFIPGKLKYITIVHYLHRVYPSLSQSAGSNSLQANILNFIMPVKNISPLTALAVLAGIACVCIALSSMLLSVKEYYAD